jgi:hypothetical protein
VRILRQRLTSPIPEKVPVPKGDGTPQTALQACLRVPDILPYGTFGRRLRVPSPLVEGAPVEVIRTAAALMVRSMVLSAQSAGQQRLSLLQRAVAAGEEVGELARLRDENRRLKSELRRYPGSLRGGLTVCRPCRHQDQGVPRGRDTVLSQRRWRAELWEAIPYQPVQFLQLLGHLLSSL